METLTLRRSPLRHPPMPTPPIQDRECQHNITRHRHCRALTTTPNPSLKHHILQTLWHRTETLNTNTLHPVHLHQNNRHLRPRCSPLGTSSIRSTQNLPLCQLPSSKLRGRHLSNPTTSHKPPNTSRNKRNKHLRHLCHLLTHPNLSRAHTLEPICPRYPPPTRITQHPHPLDLQQRKALLNCRPGWNVSSQVLFFS